jgi:hypothetical protein
MILRKKIKAGIINTVFQSRPLGKLGNSLRLREFSIIIHGISGVYFRTQVSDSLKKYTSSQVPQVL